MDRRNFLKNTGLGSLPLVTGGLAGLAFRPAEEIADGPVEEATVHFTRDGIGYTPAEYISKLQEINTAHPVKPDFYGTRGTVEELLKKFADMTGKEVAFYMPSGTLANQLAIQVLSAENTKVFVQETSHVFRDEGDAAQSLFNKRLVPLARGKHFFTLEELQQEIAYDAKEEYFKTGVGAISIEIPLRRNDNAVFPIEEIKKISAWCREKGYKLHLDGARLHLAASWSGVSVHEYASYFDTVYMCLYKYLGATSGAILCGSKAVMDPMEHLVKVHGGSMYQNWTNAAIALHNLEGIEERLQTTREKAERLFKTLNQITGIHIEAPPQNSNVFYLRLAKGYDGTKFAGVLREQYAVRIPSPEADGISRIRVNESLLLREVDSIVAAFRAALPLAKV
ncbi:MAG TPA: aminotransferase class I/II-fold pyridoxal phosphate-dependent enzyme [Puia sp.]|jgi:threonine aldolase